LRELSGASPSIRRATYSAPRTGEGLRGKHRAAKAAPLRAPIHIAAWKFPLIRYPTGDGDRIGWLDEQWVPDVMMSVLRDMGIEQ
jgi:hypothetical protein